MSTSLFDNARRFLKLVPLLCRWNAPPGKRRKYQPDVQISEDTYLPEGRWH
jgi:hypothetical protein